MSEKTACAKVKADGTQCKMVALPDSEYCRVHTAPEATVERDNVPDFSGGLCAEHFPMGWPEDSESGGCAHGSFVRG